MTPNWSRTLRLVRQRCLPCFGFLFFGPLGLAQHWYDRRSAEGEAEGVSCNSRQMIIIISMFTVHTRPQWQRRLLFDGVNVQKAWWGYYSSQPWCIWKQYSLQTQKWVAHQGRWQWVMLWSWWTVMFQHVSQTFLYNLCKGRRRRRKSNWNFTLTCWKQLWTFHSTGLRMTNVVSAKNKAEKMHATEAHPLKHFDKQQADYGVALHKQLSISSTACKVKVARWTLHCLSQLRHFTLVKVSISF